MKAVLVIDVPNDMKIKETKALHITLTNGMFTKEMNIYSSLRPLPNGFGIDIEEDYALGFNACLAKITGETE